MTLDKKIQAGFFSCCMVLLVVAIFSFRNSEKFIDTNQWVNHTHEVLYEFDQVLINSVNAETGARGFVITNEESYLEPFNTAKSRLFEHIRKVRELTRDNPGQQKNIDVVERLSIAQINHLEKTIEMRRQDFEKARPIVVAGEGKRIEDELRKVIDQAKGIEQSLLVERRQASEADARNFNFIFVVLLLIIVGVLVVVYFIIATNLKALKKAETETANKNWSLTGSADLVKKMQGNKLVGELSETIINHLAVYLNAHIGAFYLVENSNTSLRLTAWHAIDKSKRELPVVRFGEGLVGQAAAEKRTIALDQINPGYFNMTTGFGDASPKNIIAVPFAFENMVVGVIELGSLHDFDDLKKQYLQLVVDSIAIAVTSSQAREKAKELLEETLRQAEELTAQQEELKQSNDELHAKTELLERSELELKTQQEELRQANEELGEKADLLEYQKEKLENAKTEIEIKAGEIEVTSKYKSEFLANMSHELRTPLNSILILAQLLAENKNDVLGKKEMEYAKNIHNSGTDLLNLINEILDLSKVEAGKMELDIAEVTLQGIADNMSALFSELARDKSIEFTIDPNRSGLPAAIKTDKQRVEQVLKNLLSNAFKFTPGGGKVSLKIHRPIHDADGVKQIAFSVTDTGIGITRDKQGVIFEAFQQADGSTKRKYGGTGLGLSISRELVHVLGGKIQLESEEGRGSTFTVYLPLQFDPALIVSDNKQIEIKEKQTLKIERAAKSEEFQLDDTHPTDDRNRIQENDKVILIIEDEEAFANVLLDFIRERKYKGIIARQGNTGISYARHFKPDAICST